MIQETQENRDSSNSESFPAPKHGDSARGPLSVFPLKKVRMIKCIRDDVHLPRKRYSSTIATSMVNDRDLVIWPSFDGGSGGSGKARISHDRTHDVFVTLLLAKCIVAPSKLMYGRLAFQAWSQGRK